MSTAVHPLLAILLVAGALLLGLRWGRARERRREADANSQAFAAGFRAGHLQGWRDSQAAREPAAATIPSAAPAPTAPLPPPVRPAAHEQRRPLTVQRPAPPQVAAPAAPRESAADRAARKEKRDRLNINITLYVASLLLVAAGALFIGTALPVALRFAGVVAITALFYAGGLILHAKAPRLR